MKINVRTKINKGKLQQISTNAEKALIMTAEALKTDLYQSQTMPFRTGNLQNDNTFVDDKKIKTGIVKIVSDTPYARKLYFHPEYNFYRGNIQKKIYKRKSIKAKKKGEQKVKKKNLNKRIRKSRSYNKNAGGRWFDTYISGPKKDLAKQYYIKIMKKMEG